MGADVFPQQFIIDYVKVYEWVDGDGDRIDSLEGK
jgi:hypothetical protein